MFTSSGRDIIAIIIEKLRFTNKYDLNKSIVLFLPLKHGVFRSCKF